MAELILALRFQGNPAVRIIAAAIEKAGYLVGPLGRAGDHYHTAVWADRSAIAVINDGSRVEWR